MLNPKIADHHLTRKACIYIRQSTMAQVRFNQESTERQYNLADQAKSLGWMPEQIRILDGDLAQSGELTTKRDDFKTLVSDVAMGQVGAIFSLESSRLARSNRGFFNGASSVVVASNGDIFVGDGHGGNTNDRVVKFDKTGKQILTWGKHGKGQGEFDQLHGIAMDSQGRIFVADRGNSRIQIFDSNGKFVAEWKQFGRPSDVAIDKNDVIYVADDQSNQTNNPGFKTGIRIGSAKDGKVTAFIPTPSAEIATPEGVGFDDTGNVYGSWTGKMAVRRWTKS
jgi:hypothetical protein